MALAALLLPSSCLSIILLLNLVTVNFYAVLKNKQINKKLPIDIAILYIIHLTLVACARSPHLQDMLSRLELCCRCWSVISMYVNSAPGRRWARVEYCVPRPVRSWRSPFATPPQHSDVPLQSPGRHPGTQFHCNLVCCLTTEDML